MSNYIDEFRNTEDSQRMASILSKYNGSPITIMEVCGTHTMAIFKYGIKGLLPKNIKLVSGPGCPVCVTPGFYINAAIELSNREDVIITTFGDLMKVPGSKSSLLKKKSEGKDIRIVYSPLDSISIALENPNKKIIFLSIGFETTSPIEALSILKAKEEGVQNYYMLCANKTMPEALKVLAVDKDVCVDGYLYPGHVSAIIGTKIYEEMSGSYGIPGVVAGFEPLDILYAIITLVSNINKHKTVVENQYSRVVSPEGNQLALDKMYEVFEPCDAVWRGIGNIQGSGLKIRDKYSEFDAWNMLKDLSFDDSEPIGCLCGEILKGKKTPTECKLYGKLCTPENPVGACMVSSEGTCAAYFRYDGRTKL